MNALNTQNNGLELMTAEELKTTNGGLFFFNITFVPINLTFSLESPPPPPAPTTGPTFSFAIG